MNLSGGKKLYCRYVWSSLDRLILFFGILAIGLTAVQAVVLGQPIVLSLTWLPAGLCLLAVAFLLLIRPTIFAPAQLFERLKDTVRANILDPSKLPDLENDDWKDSSSLLTLEDFYQKSQEMFSEIGDFYTCLLSPEPVPFGRAGRSLADYGISCGVKLSGDRLLIFDGDGNLQPEQDELGRPLISAVIQGSTAFQAGFRAGDVILSKDGRSQAGISLGLLNTLSQREDTAFVLLRDGCELPAVLPFGCPAQPPLSLMRLNDDIGCLRVESFEKLSSYSLSTAVERLSGFRSMIVDLRGNRGGDIRSALVMLSGFLSQGTLAYFQRRGQSGKLETMRFQLDQQLISIESRQGDSQDYLPVRSGERLRRLAERGHGKPLIVLVDRYSMSGAELFAGAVKDLGRAKVIGEKTFGKGVGQDVIGIPPCVKVSVTALRFTTPAGHWPGDGAISVSDGIEPDEAVAAGSGVIIGGTSDFQLMHAVKLLSQ